MAVGQKTIDSVVNQLLLDKKEYTTKELAKLMGIGLSTAQQVVSVGMMIGSIVKNNGYPAKYSAVSIVPQTGETLIIKEPIAPLELSEKLQKEINDQLITGQTPNGPIGLVFEAYYKLRVKPTNREAFRVFLINFAHIIKEVIENETELHPEDISVK